MCHSDTNMWIAGLFYGGYGTVIMPSLHVAESYGGFTPEYYNAFGFFVLST